jgi:FAD/FMN-containing dehydrogenase
MLKNELMRIVGVENVLSETEAESYLVDYRRRYVGRALAVVKPLDADQVAKVVRLCLRNLTPVVVQGGNTGLVGGATPDVSGNAVLISLQRLNRVRQVDTQNDSITVDAGVTLAAVQQAARHADRLFPLSLGSEGSCTIGGNLATNAGGTQVLRYGNTRELTLGLEVVTAEGEIWDGLRSLRKDNTGYALRDLYIGSEGTLGIITAATLKLFPLPTTRNTALLVFSGIDEAISFLSVARHKFGAGLTAFELFPKLLLKLIEHHLPGYQLPLQRSNHPWYALVELSDHEDATHARQLLERVLGEALEAGLLVDVVVAESLKQSEALWSLRHEILGDVQRREGENLKHDISIPISLIPKFLLETEIKLAVHCPGLRVLVFGHLGDGNLHYHVLHAPEKGVAKLLMHEAAIHEIVHDCAHACGGSISAEHGIGQVKRAILPRYKNAVELDLMRRLKQTFDPLGLLNPGKVL